MEMRNRQVNHARNIWDRAVQILPRVNLLWHKYTYMEERLGNVAGARQVFERWLQWQPDEQAWHSYISFELRYREVDRAEGLYQRFVLVHPEVKNWIKYAPHQEKQGTFAHARKVYERAGDYFGEERMDECLYVAFAKSEENRKEFERARVIYRYALHRIPKQAAQELLRNYSIFEKKFGTTRGIEDVIVSRRRFQYEEEVKTNPHNYDAWFDYLHLLETHGEEPDALRDAYERAIANVLPNQEKRHWRRYINLWIHYALHQELEAKDPETRQVYQACLKLIPHQKFTFAKMWLLYAQFEIRQKNLPLARRALGTSIGKCPKSKLFRGYIELELRFREFQRCRQLEKFLELAPESCPTRIQFAELETILGDVDRARAIYELAVDQPCLDTPEVLWKAYIDFKTEQEESEKTRSLYRRLLQRTQHVKVWLGFAQFELSEGKEESLTCCRQIYEEANKRRKNNKEQEQRFLLLQSWKNFEHEFGTESQKARVDQLLAQRARKRRKVQAEDGSDAGWEECSHYIFPEEEENQPHLKLLAEAKLWKKRQRQEEAAEQDPEKDTH
ncbi:LOW QUALITY PROTEIN: crooked neck-like protein 1 [Sarcophilus harrisii]